MNDILRQIEFCGIVPVVKIEDAEKAVPLCRALIKGGIRCVEITFRTSAAAEAIERITNELPEMLVGAGTVLTSEQADAAVAAGAKFIVSPGFNPENVKYCLSKGITVVPGCATCGEMEQAMALGLDTVKFFPAEANGGAAAIKAMSAPYKGLHFMPTGGVSLDNMMDYLSLPCVVACGGSFMVKEALIKAENYDEITRLTYQAVAKMHGFFLKHVGINCADENDCRSTADKLCRFAMVSPDERSGAIFAGTLFEVMKNPGLGTNGHIAIGCNFPFRALAFLESQGFAPDMSTAKYDEKGKLKVVYFKDEIGGFAFHIVGK